MGSGPTSSFLVEAVRYNSWANRTLAEFCATLPAGLLASSTEGTYGAIPATFSHLASADTRFLAVVAPLPAGLPEDGTTLDLAGAARVFALLAPAWEAFAENPGPADRVINDPRGGTRPGIVFAQLMNHGSEHRTHVQSILGPAGIEGPRIDAWGYGITGAN